MSRRERTRLSASALAVVGIAFLGWATPQCQLNNLVENPGKDCVEWENFRDTKCRKWVTLNVTCGLIMGAVTTVISSNYPLSQAAFVLGAFSLLSGLIATSLGTALIYTLGDLKGPQYQRLMSRHPTLFAFALVLPQTWALICFMTFYVAQATILWDATGKLWIAKATVGASVLVVTIHLPGFIYAFRAPDSLTQGKF